MTSNRDRLVELAESLIPKYRTDISYLFLLIQNTVCLELRRFAPKDNSHVVFRPNDDVQTNVGNYSTSEPILFCYIRNVKIMPGNFNNILVESIDNSTELKNKKMFRDNIRSAYISDPSQIIISLNLKQMLYKNENSNGSQYQYQQTKPLFDNGLIRSIAYIAIIIVFVDIIIPTITHSEKFALVNLLIRPLNLLIHNNTGES